MRLYSDFEIKKLLNKMDFSKIEQNLLPVIAFANREAVSKSLSTGYVYYYSRSKNRLRKKGEQSGHVQEIQKVLIDCDYDSILYKVK